MNFDRRMLFERSGSANGVRVESGIAFAVVRQFKKLDGEIVALVSVVLRLYSSFGWSSRRLYVRRRLPPQCRGIRGKALLDEMRPLRGDKACGLSRLAGPYANAPESRSLPDSPGRSAEPVILRPRRGRAAALELGRLASSSAWRSGERTLLQPLGRRLTPISLGASAARRNG